MASALLTVKFLRKGKDCIVAGFLIFAIGESLLLAGTAAGLAASVPSFAGGVPLWATALFADEHSQGVRYVGSSCRSFRNHPLYRHGREIVLG
jgi:hypothetical protein